jgi:hypothetical protein
LIFIAVLRSQPNFAEAPLPHVPRTLDLSAIYKRLYACGNSVFIPVLMRLQRTRDDHGGLQPVILDLREKHCVDLVIRQKREVIHFLRSDQHLIHWHAPLTKIAGGGVLIIRRIELREIV